MLSMGSMNLLVFSSNGASTNSINSFEILSIYIFQSHEINNMGMNGTIVL
jgi:hypothetical protein